MYYIYGVVIIGIGLVGFEWFIWGKGWIKLYVCNVFYYFKKNYFIILMYLNIFVFIEC